MTVETNWDTAPSVMESIDSLRLSPRECNLDYWYRNVASNFTAHLVNGHEPDAIVPEWMIAEGPFREAILTEFAFRSIAEEKAARAISHLVLAAPTSIEMNFYATQLIDEARHADAFRAHMGEIVGSDTNLDDLVEGYAALGRANVLDPLEEFALRILGEDDSFIAGVAVLTILVEGVLAPTGELSERKWLVVNPAGAGVERGAAIDELRHLAVGSEIIKDAVAADPSIAARISAIVNEGLTLWAQLPIVEEMRKRETLFEEGLDRVRNGDAPAALCDSLHTYECWPGVRLLDTDVETRLNTALSWSGRAQLTRLEYMGLSDALTH